MSRHANNKNDAAEPVKAPIDRQSTEQDSTGQQGSTGRVGRSRRSKPSQHRFDSLFSLATKGVGLVGPADHPSHHDR